MFLSPIDILPGIRAVFAVRGRRGRRRRRGDLVVEGWRFGVWLFLFEGGDFPPPFFDRWTQIHMLYTPLRIYMPSLTLPYSKKRFGLRFRHICLYSTRMFVLHIFACNRVTYKYMLHICEFVYPCMSRHLTPNLADYFNLIVSVVFFNHCNYAILKGGRDS